MRSTVHNLEPNQRMSLLAHGASSTQGHEAGTRPWAGPRSGDASEKPAPALGAVTRPGDRPLER